MKKMTLWGVGPKIMFPGYTILFILSLLPVKINISEILNIPRTGLTVAAIIFMSIGIVMLAIAASEIKKSLKVNQLITAGLYSRIRNPMYAAHIFFLMPGICLLINDVKTLLSIIFTIIIFLILISGEEKVLADNFGSEYLRYKTRTGRLLPKFF
jgi:protein-S-isoprenylcysteine O-methyltransferase Ste14